MFCLVGAHYGLTAITSALHRSAAPDESDRLERFLLTSCIIASIFARRVPIFLSFHGTQAASGCQANYVTIHLRVDVHHF